MICPIIVSQWYNLKMSGTYSVTMGDRGRFVIPAELRDRVGLRDGSIVSLIETPRGVLLLSRDQLKALVRADLGGLQLVDELLADRRRRAQVEDAE